VLTDHGDAKVTQRLRKEGIRFFPSSAQSTLRQLIAADTAMSPPFGVERAALTASEVHLSRKPIGEQSAQHENPTKYRYR
jgi:hypothetical protein